jgi:DHA1 family tetracycline resistance protein-like MFS transporter
MKRPAPSLLFVFLTLLLDVLGFGLIIPVAPKLVASVQGLPVDGAESEAALAYGALAATYAAMQFIFAPILGSLSDRFGRRPVILISLLGSGIDYFVAAWAPNLAILFITRAVNGISGANMTACSAYIADVTPPEKRAASYGIIGAAFGLGFVLGPLMGGFLGDPGIHIPLIGPGDIRHPYIAAGILTLANWLFGVFVLPESLPPDRRRAFSWGKANPAGALRWLWGHSVVVRLAAALLLLNIANFALHSTWALAMYYRFQWSTEEVGWSLFAVGISAAIVQGGLARKIIPAIGERASLVAGIVIGVGAFIGYGLAPEGWMIYVIIVAASIGGIAGPAVQGITTKAVPPTEQGLLQGALASLQSVAMVIGPLAGAGVFRYFTAEGAPVILPERGGSAPFLLGGALCLASLWPVAAAWRHLPSSVAEAPDESTDESPAKTGVS